MAQGRSYQRIVEAFPDCGSVNARGLQANFANGHVPINAPAVRAVGQARSAEVGDVLLPLIAQTALNLSFARAVVEWVQARLEAGDLEPSIRGGVAAAELIGRLRDDGCPATIAEYRLYFAAVLEAAKEIMSPSSSTICASACTGTSANARAQCQPRINGKAVSARRQRCLRPAPRPKACVSRSANHCRHRGRGSPACWNEVPRVGRWARPRAECGRHPSAKSGQHSQRAAGPWCYSA